jgi:hypothetical protein
LAFKAQQTLLAQNVENRGRQGQTEATKRDIEAIFRTPGDKIDVVYEGVDWAKFDFSNDGRASEAFLKRYNFPSSYLLERRK